MDGKVFCTEVYMCQRLFGTHARRGLVVDGRTRAYALKGALQFHGRWLDLLITRISFGYPVDVLPSPVDTPASGPGRPDYRGVHGSIRLVRPGANRHANRCGSSGSDSLLFFRNENPPRFLFSKLEKKLRVLLLYFIFGYLATSKCLTSNEQSAEHKAHTSYKFSPR
jgi:hypothetical protein